MDSPTAADVVSLEECQRRLSAVTFPALVRPAVPDGQPATPELVSWASRFYVFCVLAQLREMVATFVLLVREKRWPGSHLAARSLFELAGHVLLVRRKVVTALEGHDNDAAFAFLKRATTGNRFKQEHPDEEEWSKPLHVNDCIRELDAAFSAMRGAPSTDMSTSYDWLSEHSHPNMGLFLLHYGWEAEGVVRVKPVPQATAPVNETHIVVALALDCLREMVDDKVDPELSATLAVALWELTESPRPS